MTAAPLSNLVVSLLAGAPALLPFVLLYLGRRLHAEESYEDEGGLDLLHRELQPA